MLNGKNREKKEAMDELFLHFKMFCETKSGEKLNELVTLIQLTEIVIFVITSEEQNIHQCWLNLDDRQDSEVYYLCCPRQ